MADKEAGGRQGSGEFSVQLDKINRVNRIKELQTTNTDLKNDEFYFTNQNGFIECRLCCTHHKTRANYISHTYGKVHQRNLARKLVIDSKKAAWQAGNHVGSQPTSKTVTIKRETLGKPEFSVSKHMDNRFGILRVLFEITYKEIKKNSFPMYRVMSAYEQQIEEPDPRYQYVLFAAIPYDTIAIKIPNLPLISERTIEEWKVHDQTYYLELSLSKSVQNTE